MSVLGERRSLSTTRKSAAAPAATALAAATLVSMSIVAKGTRVTGLRVSIGSRTPQQLAGHTIAVVLFRSNGLTALTMQAALESVVAASGADDIATALVPVTLDVDAHDLATWWAVVSSAEGARLISATGEVSATGEISATGEVSAPEDISATGEVSAPEAIQNKYASEASVGPE